MCEYRRGLSRFTYRVTWSAEDHEFVATCAEFLSLSWLDADEIEALRGLQDLCVG
ncbi:hypothetical protein [Micromonospora sp. AKA38]|uniref:hypothetical protein n=1 Tax=Micromonospora sp. AKA38 TaxID=2733861 RepID=UPI0022BF9366|nr:hypothetical protein [Micromonospora sp. AKA38]GHJ17909.1 hypothetical protein TPA0908_59040 [Micromonospora sp. AKA38]